MQAPTNWWQSFFQGVAVDLWRGAVSDEQTQQEVDFLEQQLELAPKSKILDVPCGGGRHSVELVRRGYQVTGLDYSKEFMEEARSKSSEVHWIQGDMRELPVDQGFDAIVCLGNSFGYLDDEGNVTFLQRAFQALQPGGKLMLNTGCTMESLLPNFPEREWYELGGMLFLLENQFDAVAGRLQTKYVFVRDGKQEVRPGSQRCYGFRELSDVMRGIGYENVRGLGDFDGTPFGLGSQQLWLFAENPSDE